MSKVLTRSVDPVTRAGRFRSVFGSADSVCHEWSNQRIPSGRAGNVYFDGPVIFSYGKHFPVARHVKRAGANFVLFTSLGYSNSTAKHKGRVLRSIRGQTVFTVPNVMADTYQEHTANFLSLVADATESIRKAGKARTYKGMHLREALRIVERANAYAAAVGIKRRHVLEDEEAIRAEIERAEVEQAAKDIERRNKRVVELSAVVAKWEQMVEAWKDGGEWPGYCPDYSHPSARLSFLRLRGTRLETSQRVIIPLSAALPILEAIRGNQELPIGYSVEGFGLREVNRERREVTIGCHTITFDEIERVALANGL